MAEWTKRDLGLARPLAWRGLSTAVRAVVFPLPCVACTSRTSESIRRGLCKQCTAALRPTLGSQPLEWPNRLVSCFLYDGAAKHVVLAAKRTGHHAVIDVMAVALAERLPANCVITWAPTADDRRIARGYDHAELLARRVAKRVGSPAVGLLKRNEESSAQHGRSAAARREVSFRIAHPTHARSRTPVAGRPLVVIDDVRTTGATLRAAIDVLRDLSATEIVGLTYAAADRSG